MRKKKRNTRRSRQTDKIRKRLARSKTNEAHNQENDNQTPGSSRTLQPAEKLAFHEFPRQLQDYFNTDGDIFFHSKNDDARKKLERAKKYREKYQNDEKYREKKKKYFRDFFKKHSTKQNSINKKKRQCDKIRYWSNARYKLLKMKTSILRYASNPAFRNKLRLYSSEKYANNPLFAANVRNSMMSKYRNNKTYKEKKKRNSRLKYGNNVPFQESVKRASTDKYKTNIPFQESVKRASTNKYNSNIPFQESVKRASTNKYKTNIPFQESVKRASTNKYKTNIPFQESVKRASTNKYKTNIPFQESVKRASVQKYKNNAPFRESVKRSSVKKYKINMAFQNSVKAFSKMKYMRFESFRNNVKASSIKKYSSNPLFRYKIKQFLRKNYQNSSLIREIKKRRVNLYRKSVVKAISKFKKSVQDVPVYVCTVCSRMLYKSQVKICKHSVYSTAEGLISDIASECITGKFVHQCNDACKVNCHKAKEWICFTCDRHLRAGNMPPQALANGLTLAEIPPQLKKLNNLERQLVAMRIPFMKVLSLPKGGQKGVKGPCINVPSDLNSVTSTLPRPLNDSQMIKVKLKRKLAYKGHQMYEWIDPKNVQEALQYLIRHNKWYKNVTINNMWYNDDDFDLIQNMDIPGNTNDSESELMECDESTVNNEIHDTSPESNDNFNSNQNVDHHNTNLVQHMSEHITEVPSENVLVTMDRTENENKSKKNNEEIPSYPVETCLQPIDLGQEVLDTNGKIFCVAPAEKQTPRSIFKDEGMDAMSFPHLLPDGDFGFSMERRIKLTPSKYFNARILSADTRFATDVQFIFFAQYVTEITDIRSKISIALRKGKNTTTDGRKINAGMLRTPESVQNLLKSDIGYRFLQPIRGSPPYWERTMKELHSMIRQIGIPTFFVTFSAGETRWSDLIDTLLGISDDTRNPDDLEWLDKCKLIKDNPVMCSRLFDHRVKALFRDLLMSPANPIGKVVDFFIRTEFQQRGSPHIHCLVWIENAPRLDVNADTISYSSSSSSLLGS